MKCSIFRILGNDLIDLHGPTQTLTNLRFTLENEATFKNCDKIYVLNRIHDKQYKEVIISLLKHFKSKFIVININYKGYLQLPNIFNIKFEELSFSSKVYTTYLHNMYVININNCRNFCIDLGKSLGYEWTFVFDGNNFIHDNFFTKVIMFPKETQVIAVPQIRLQDLKCTNEHILLFQQEFDSFIHCNMIEKKEPQLGFKITSNIYFNENICYGIADKAELLNAMNIKGSWNNYGKLNQTIFGIIPRNIKVKHEMISYIIRLSSLKYNNNCRNNYYNRFLGTYFLYKQIYIFVILKKLFVCILYLRKRHFVQLNKYSYHI